MLLTICSRFTLTKLTIRCIKLHHNLPDRFKLLLTLVRPIVSNNNVITYVHKVIEAFGYFLRGSTVHITLLGKKTFPIRSPLESSNAMHNTILKVKHWLMMNPSPYRRYIHTYRQTHIHMTHTYIHTVFHNLLRCIISHYFSYKLW